MKRPAFRLLLVVTFAALATPGAPHDRASEARIPHLDGSGTETIVDVSPSVPGAEDFVRATPGPIPRPGEIILPPSTTPTRSPVPTPTSRRYGTP